MDSSLVVIELACLALLALAAALRARAPDARGWLTDAPIVGLAALVGEDSCIRLYGTYAYAPGWHLFVDQLPLFIPLIWVFVVLSARDVSRALGGPLARTAFAVIVFDAALIEPCCTSAGLWTWAEPGVFRVPYIGVLGWACFGASAVFWLSRLEGKARWWTVVLAPLCMHAMLLALWWGAFRWFGRFEASSERAAICAWLFAAALVAWLNIKRRMSVLPLELVLPRLGPAAFFLALLATRVTPAPLWGWAVAFVPPWLVATRWNWAPVRLGLRPRSG